VKKRMTKEDFAPNPIVKVHGKIRIKRKNGSSRTHNPQSIEAFRRMLDAVDQEIEKERQK